MFEGKGNNPALETIAPFSGTVHQNQLGFQMCMFYAVIDMKSSLNSCKHFFRM